MKKVLSQAPYFTYSSGQLLLEIIVALAVVILLVTGLVSTTTSTIRKSNFAQSKSLATKYAQEGMEMIRQQRNASWDTFRANADSSCQDVLGECFSCISSTGDISAAGDDKCASNINSQFTRFASFIWHDDTDPTKQYMEVTVTVSWKEGESVYQSEISSSFTKWQ